MRRRMPRWEDLSWPEIRERIERGMIAVLPAGSLEQHGPHLPTGTDVYIPIGLLDRLAENGRPPVPRMVMLPRLWYTYARESDWWPGTLNVDGVSLTGYVKDIARDLFRQGVNQLVILNGHVESAAFLMEGLSLAVGDNPGCTALLVNWWDLVKDDMIAELFGKAWAGWEVEHAALTETSLMMAMFGDKVRADRAVDDKAPRQLPYKMVPQPAESRAPSGVFSSVSLATVDIGNRLAAHIGDRLLEILLERFGD